MKITINERQRRNAERELTSIVCAGEMSTREIAQQIILTGGKHAHGSIMCFERNALADAIDSALTKAIADERARCAGIAQERAAFNRRMAQTFKVDDPIADLKHTRADEGDIIANEIAAIRRDSTGEEGS